MTTLKIGILINESLRHIFSVLFFKVVSQSKLCHFEGHTW